jgi:hypothetical protein
LFTRELYPAREPSPVDEKRNRHYGVESWRTPIFNVASTVELLLVANT